MLKNNSTDSTSSKQFENITTDDDILIGASSDNSVNTTDKNDDKDMSVEEKIAGEAVHNMQKKKTKNGIKYRALVGIKAAHVDGPKRVRDEYHISMMSDILKHWDSTLPVRPYYDRSIDPDDKYKKIIQHTDVLTELKKKNHDIDSPIDVLNYYGNPIGQIYYKQIPAEDRKNRNKMRNEYEKIKSDYKARGEKLPDEIKEEYEYAIQEPVPGKATGLYGYSRVNPEGMFCAYDYPIQDAYNGISTQTSKLVNRNYGTYQDIIKLRDLDFEATMLPEVIFRYDGKMFESDDPKEIEKFLYEAMGADDYVALIECYM